MHDDEKDEEENVKGNIGPKNSSNNNNEISGKSSQGA
jgi:hypothetical protein